MKTVTVSLALLVFCLLGCATRRCEKTTADPILTTVVLPPMSESEMAEIGRETPKLNCQATYSSVTLTLRGRLNTFMYGQSGLENGFRVCLVGELTEWRPVSEFCRAYVPNPRHEYRFGPFPLPKKNLNRFSFANVAQGVQYRWGGIQFVQVSGACRQENDDGGDRLEFTKHN